MKLSKVLAEKNVNDIFSIHIDATVRDAAKLMSEKKIGSLFVTSKLDEPDSYVGIITERLIISKCWQIKKFLDIKIREIMNEDLVIAKPTADVQYALNAMTRHNSRYLGVCEESKLIGIVSRGDIIKALHEEKKIRITYLSEMGGTYGNKVY